MSIMKKQAVDSLENLYPSNSHFLVVTAVTTSFLSDIITYLLTYLLIPWSRVLLEKLTGLKLVKKFPAVYGTQRFITTFKSARHLSQT